ncbi:MAG: hypothetical protein LPK19_12290, partial [Hymenobacteraceae bacterium]|nr:hypothetical protein [Hymenobacteraceae bacterium]MDX5397003.1 hypothetical protein [Hymenobacteraceae bacterium]MDX5513077.1 hypothetical protein [Hymenobacteraceae bacterium]
MHKLLYTLALAASFTAAVAQTTPAKKRKTGKKTTVTAPAKAPAAPAAPNYQQLQEAASKYAGTITPDDLSMLLHVIASD